ncbi:oligosaccharide flippase family protein [uncultured Paraglaciecola sp.]|uniref:oligosaccharide flippase family protein n=1 Tax=uncultured Paraglaciecola sp. TaxID=1765024 RepID=UPI0030DCACF5
MKTNIFKNLLQENYMSKVRNALKFSMVGTYLGKIINLLSVIVIARIMTPDELGLYAIAAALVMIVDVLKSFGVSSYLIRQKVLASDEIRSALGLNIVITSVLGIGIIAVAQPLETYYGYNDIAILLLLLSVSFFVSPFFSNGMALLARQFKFKERLQIGITAQIFEFSITVLFIMLDFSYFSMAIAVALKSLLQVLLVKIYQPTDMQWYPRFIGMKHIAKFGFFITLANLFERLSIVSNDLIIGKFGTPGMVAYFSRGLGFIDFLTATVSEGISPVTLPYLAEQKRLGHDLEPAYYQATNLLGAVLLPVLLVAGVASYPVIMLFFGDQWVQSAELVSILCLWGVFKNIHALSPSLLVITGHERHLFIRNMIMFSLTAFSVYFAFQYGLLTIAMAVTGVAFVNFIYTTLLLKFVLNFSLLNFSKSQLTNVLLCTTCFGASYLTSLLINFEEVSIFISLAILIPFVSLTWLLTLYFTKHLLLNEIKKIVGLANE